MNISLDRRSAVAAGLAAALCTAAPAALAQKRCAPWC